MSDAQKTLSVIIPAYNAQEYLEKCVRSVASCRNIADVETIIVNDGSTDGTLELANKLAAEYPQSVSVIDKPNGGHGSGINVAAYICKGKYFKALDADDWFDTAELEKLVEALKVADADCVITSYTKVFEKDGSSCSVPVGNTFEAGKVVSYEEFIQKARLAIHSVCYRTERYTEAGIKLSEKCFYEDTQFIYYPLAAFRTVVCYPFDVYRYRLNRAGQSVSRAGFMKHCDDHRRVVGELLEFYSGFDDGKPMIKAFLKRELAGHLLFGQHFFATPDVTSAQWKDNVAYVRSIKKRYKEIYKAMSIKYRALYRLPACGVRLVVKLFRPHATDDM